MNSETAEVIRKIYLQVEFMKKKNSYNRREGSFFTPATPLMLDGVIREDIHILKYLSEEFPEAFNRLMIDEGEE